MFPVIINKRSVFRILGVMSILIAASVLLNGVPAGAQDDPPVQTNLAIVLDMSGSMWNYLGEAYRMDIAKQAIIDLSQQIPADVNVSLWVYGHRLPQDDPAASCEDIEQVIALDVIDVTQFEAAVSQLTAIGYTPIAESLQRAAKTLPKTDDQRNIIVLLSDGEETCGGDPCAVAEFLYGSHTNLSINTIGFAADEATRQQLQCIADVAGGEYYDAQDAEALQEALFKAAEAITGRVYVQDDQGNAVPYNVYDADGNLLYTNRALTTELPPGDYTIEIITEPPFDTITDPIHEVTVVVDQQIEVVVGAPGTLVVKNTAGGFVAFNLYGANGAPLYQNQRGTLELAPGNYTVEIITAPPYQMVTDAVREVTIVTGERAEVIVTAPGTLYVQNAVGQFVVFDLFTIDGTMVYEYRRGPTELAPGEYTVRISETGAEYSITVISGERLDLMIN
jgi:hypothetical protein